MPPFKLEFPDRRPTHSRQVQLLYTKNLYSEGVKARNWNRRLEYRPIDADPYCPGSQNYFVAHYNRFGTGKEDQFKTTTQEMLEQIHTKEDLIPNKLLANYYLYDE